ncbi:MAG: D-Ala-D-Ala carboxypeptidase family metallohydrolase [Myxococcota bacterium]|nr:D-Ala-D-Ala carboxypeptidase family metallohydrolase [Myxococcota bacterium]
MVDEAVEEGEARAAGKSKVVRLALIVSLVGCLGLVLFQWQGWRIPYTSIEVGGEGVDPAALEALNRLRLDARHRWWVFSGYRSPEFNQLVGGKSRSQHLTGRAFDMLVSQGDRERFYAVAKGAGFKGFGWGNRTVHVDLGPRRWWTYDQNNEAVSGPRKHRYLANAPENFKRDYGIKGR